MDLFKKVNIVSLTIMTVLLILFAALNTQGVFADEGDIASGDYWRITSDHELIIGQDGVEYKNFPLYNASQYPWSEFRNRIRGISFRGKVYAVNGNSFSGYGNSVFYSCGDSLLYADLTGLDTSNVTSMSFLFSNCNNLESIKSCSFDTGKVINMSYMFNECINLESIDVSGFDTSNVTDMSFMFYNCRSLSGVDVSGFDTGNVTYMNSMFNGCSSLTNIDVSGFDTGNVTNLSYMFSDCDELTGLDVSGFNTSNATDMASMFFNCSSLTSIDVSGFDTSNVTNMTCMFNGCSSLTDIDVSGFDTSFVSEMIGMFSGCSSLTNIDVSGFDTSFVLKMAGMFSGCSRLKNLDLRGFDTSYVTYMDSLFFGCRSLTSLDLSSFNTSKVISMDYMFNSCSSLTSLNLSSFDTSKVTSNEDMFTGCSITDVALGDKTIMNALNDINAASVEKHNWQRYKMLDGTTADGPSFEKLSDYKGTDPGWYTSRNCPNGHIWNTTYTVDVPATEFAPGSRSIHCSVCGTIKEGTSETIPQLPLSAAPAATNEIIDLPVVKISKPSAAKKKITVKWKKVSKKNLKKISGIQIQVATDPDFTNIVKTATAGKKKTSKVIKGLQSKTKYYVRIRAYGADNHVSAWKSKGVKVK